MNIKHRHVTRIVILASLDPSNNEAVENITSFAINQLRGATGFTLVKRSVESNDLFVQPNQPEGKAS